MSESSIHIKLVNMAKQYIAEHVPKGTDRLIMTDSIDDMAVGSTSPNISGYRPDVYYEFKGVMYIGEAKTKDDYDREHSINQYKAFLRHAHAYTGTATMVVSVPWKCTNSVRHIIYELEKKYEDKIEIVVLDELIGK